MSRVESGSTTNFWTKVTGRGVASAEGPRRTVRLLPDPEPRPRIRRLISVDDHVVEPPHMFEGRLPQHLQDRAPRIIEDEQGNQLWQIEGKKIATIGLSAVVGRAPEDQTTDPARFDEMRRGCWDVHHRVRDMDLAGIEASVCFPSFLPGFAGRAFNQLADQEYGLALIRAWNDWHLEEWVGSYPDRLIPCQLPWMNDVEIGAAEIRRNAARGFKAVSFSENPAAHGLPSLHSGYWDPFVRACEETGTIICLHGGGSGWSAVASKDAPMGEFATMLLMNPMVAVVDWVWSQIPLRFPSVKIVMSESGLSWVPAIIERLDYVIHHTLRTVPDAWPKDEPLPSDVLRRNFWFSTIMDPIGIQLRHHVGVDRIMLECDYPHGDSTWPDTQADFDALLAGIPDVEAAMIASENAALMFGLPLQAGLEPRPA